MFGGQNWAKNLYLAMNIKRDMGRCKTNNPLVKSSILFLALFHYILCCLHRMDTHSSASAWDWHSNSKVLFLASLTLPVPFQWHLVWVLSLKVKVETVFTSAPNLWKYAVKNVLIFMVCDITEKQNCVYVDFYKILNSVKTAGWRRRKLTELFEPKEKRK